MERVFCPANKLRDGKATIAYLELEVGLNVWWWESPLWLPARVCFMRDKEQVERRN